VNPYLEESLERDGAEAATPAEEDDGDAGFRLSYIAV
jgi:hypothetical protein